MGARKRLKAEQRKEEQKNLAIAKLNKCQIAPRKMREVADLIRGVEVNQALSLLQHHPKAAAPKLEKLLRSALANWEAKNEDKRIEEEQLVVSEVFVDSAGMLKRIQPAPQGRAHRIRKRMNHVTIIVDSAK